MVGALALTACGTSTPSNRRMAEDIIETVEGLSDEERDCMRERLDGYTGSELEALNDENSNVDWDAEGATGGALWQAFVDDMSSCLDGTAPAGSDASEVGEADDGSTPADSAADVTAADDSEAGDDAEPSASSVPGTTEPDED